MAIPVFRTAVLVFRPAALVGVVNQVGSNGLSRVTRPS
jgi:hypothetical protein